MGFTGAAGRAADEAIRAGRTGVAAAFAAGLPVEWAVACAAERDGATLLLRLDDAGFFAVTVFLAASVFRTAVFTAVFLAFAFAFAGAFFAAI